MHLMNLLRRMTRRGAAAIAIAALVTSTHAAVEVSVVVERVDNLRSGDWLHCIDPQFFGCGRGDFYARMGFVHRTGDRIECARTSFEEDRDFVRPNWECLDARGNLMTVRLQGDPRFRISIWDFDGGARGIDGDDSVNIGAGQGQAVEVSIQPGVQTFVTAGPDVSVTFTLTATVLPNNIQILRSPASFTPALGEVARFEGLVDEAEGDVFAGVRAAGGGAALAVFRPPVSSSRGFAFEWNGRDAAGSLVPPGFYTVQADTVGPLAGSDRTTSVTVQVLAGR